MPAVNVNFKRGTHAALKLLNSYTEGTFYLTEDTNKLYFAQSSSKLVDLNQYIRIWDNSNPNTHSSLPVAEEGSTLEKGDIYYLSQENALIIYNGANANPVWTQLNPDTYLTAAIDAVKVTGSNSDLTQTIGVSVQDSAQNTASGSFLLIAGTNVSFAKNGNAITISSTDTNDNTTYTLGTETSAANSDDAKLTLTPSAGSKQTVHVKGSGNTHVVSDDVGNITISSEGGVKSIGLNITSAGAFLTIVTLYDDSTLTPSTITPSITYGENNDLTARFVGSGSSTGTAALNVYTKGEVDTKINEALGDADALTYKGTVNQTNASTKLTTTGSDAVAGQVYKAATDISLAGLVHVDTTKNGTAKAGDLIISSGTDGNITWEVIPSGDDQNININLGTNSDNTFTINDNSTTLGAFRLVAGTNVNISSVVDNSSGTKTFTIGHATPTSGTASTAAAATSDTTLTAATATGTSLTIPVIKSITRDTQGHVVDLTAQNYVVVDTHGEISSASTKVTLTKDATNSVTVGTGYSFDNAAEVTTNFKITSDSNSLLVSAPDTSTVKLELVWGSF